MIVSALIEKLQQLDSENHTVYLFCDDNEFLVNEVVRDEEDYGTGEKIVWIKGLYNF